MTMGTQSKFQFSAPVLLAVSGFLLAMQWLLPKEAYFWKLLDIIAIWVVFRYWVEWVRGCGVLPSIQQLRALGSKQKFVRANLRALGFHLLLAAWLIAALPDQIAHAFQGVHMPEGPSAWLSKGIASVILVIVLVFFGLLPVLKTLKEWRQDASNKGKSVEDRLDELERLKRRDMVKAEEYAAKRTDILKDL